VRQEHIYIAIEFLNIHRGYSVKEICIALKLNRSSYYKWKKRKQSKRELLNLQITEYVKEYYEESNGVLVIQTDEYYHKPREDRRTSS